MLRGGGLCIAGPGDTNLNKVSPRIRALQDRLMDSLPSDGAWECLSPAQREAIVALHRSRLASIEDSIDQRGGGDFSLHNGTGRPSALKKQTRNQGLSRFGRSRSYDDRLESETDDSGVRGVNGTNSSGAASHEDDSSDPGVKRGVGSRFAKAVSADRATKRDVKNEIHELNNLKNIRKTEGVTNGFGNVNKIISKQMNKCSVTSNGTSNITLDCRNVQGEKRRRSRIDVDGPFRDHSSSSLERNLESIKENDSSRNTPVVSESQNRTGRRTTIIDSYESETKLHSLKEVKETVSSEEYDSGVNFKNDDSVDEYTRNKQKNGCDFNNDFESDRTPRSDNTSPTLPIRRSIDHLRLKTGKDDLTTRKPSAEKDPFEGWGDHNAMDKTEKTRSRERESRQVLSHSLDKQYQKSNTKSSGEPLKSNLKVGYGAKLNSSFDYRTNLNQDQMNKYSSNWNNMILSCDVPIKPSQATASGRESRFAKNASGGMTRSTGNLANRSALAAQRKGENSANWAMTDPRRTPNPSQDRSGGKKYIRSKSLDRKYLDDDTSDEDSDFEMRRRTERTRRYNRGSQDWDMNGRLRPEDRGRNRSREMIEFKHSYNKTKAKSAWDLSGPTKNAPDEFDDFDEVGFRNRSDFRSRWLSEDSDVTRRKKVSDGSSIEFSRMQWNRRSCDFDMDFPSEERERKSSDRSNEFDRKRWYRRSCDLDLDFEYHNRQRREVEFDMDWGRRALEQYDEFEAEPIISAKGNKKSRPRMTEQQLMQMHDKGKQSKVRYEDPIITERRRLEDENGRRTRIETDHGRQTRMDTDHGRQIRMDADHGRQTRMDTDHGRQSRMETDHGRQTRMDDYGDRRLRMEDVHGRHQQFEDESGRRTRLEEHYRSRTSMGHHGREKRERSKTPHLLRENGVLSFENPNYTLGGNNPELDDALNSNSNGATTNTATHEGPLDGGLSALDSLYSELDQVCNLTRSSSVRNRRNYAHLDIESMGVDVAKGPVTNLDHADHQNNSLLDNEGIMGRKQGLSYTINQPDLIEHVNQHTTSLQQQPNNQLVSNNQDNLHDRESDDKRMVTPEGGEGGGDSGVVTDGGSTSSSNSSQQGRHSPTHIPHMTAEHTQDLYALPVKRSQAGSQNSTPTHHINRNNQEDNEEDPEDEKADLVIEDALPTGWEKHEDNDGPYYWHIKSGTITRTPPEPSDTVSAAPLRAERRNREADQSSGNIGGSVTRSNTSSALSELSDARPRSAAVDNAYKRRSYPARSDITEGSAGRPIRFAVRSLGWVEIAEEDLTPERSSKAVNRCIVDLSVGRRDVLDVVGCWGDGKDLFMDLDEGSLKLVDPENLTVLNTQPIHTIRVWGVGRDNGRERDFAYVARDRASRKHMCHVFRCDTPARTIANTLRDICKKIMIERSLQQNMNKPLDACVTSGSTGRLTRPTNLPTEHRRLHRHSQIVPPQSFPTPMEEPKKVMRVQYIGLLQVDKPSGMETLNTAIDRVIESNPAPWQNAAVAVAPSTITITSIDDGKQLAECRVRFLSFLGIGQDVKHCGFIMHTAQDQFIAYIFHCEPSSGALCKTIEAACKLRYQKCLDAHPGVSRGRGAGTPRTISATLRSVFGSITGRKARSAES